MKISEEDYLAHYGVLRRSGRYPWGSSSSQNVRNKTFLEYIKTMLGMGLTESEIAQGVGISTTQLRAAKTIAKNQQKQQQINMAQRLKDKGWANTAIGERMGLNESSVRALLAPGAADKVQVLGTTTKMLKDQVAEKTIIDVGKGVENQIGISREKLNVAVAMLREDGYELYYLKVKQLGTGNETSIKVLAPPGMSYSEVFAMRDDLGQINSFSDDGGRTMFGIKEPMPVDPKRVGVRYGPDGGAEHDGVIYVRPGVDDLSMGDSAYAQVRIQVGDKHYLKGMAMYGDPEMFAPGQDLIFNTNKTDSGNKLDSFKELKVVEETGKVDKDNPFGAQISRQVMKRNEDGSETLTSAMNIVNEEGNWNKWSKNISTQVLSKQSPQLARQQLDMTFERRQAEYDEIMALTNPTIRKKLLQEFAEGTDAAAVHMKAAALPRQRSQVILPIDTLPDGEVYAPNFRNGERVALVRYPHGGQFEIPEVIVNNNHPDSKRLLGNAKDAIAINSRVAERMSGADFDGDTVLVIPNGDRNRPGRIKSKPALEGLKDFDPKREFPSYEGMPKVKPKEMQTQMGKVSNLITDMTIQGAPPSELARAVRHSMVVIDSEKHNLDYKGSAVANGIPALKQKYQGRSDSGATTLISRASSEIRVPDRKPRPAKDGGPIDRKTGKKVFVETGKSYVNKDGVTVPSLNKSKRLAETDDAATLSSGTAIEQVYVNHSNKLKALANKARQQYVSTPRAEYSPSAKKAYSAEVDSLNSKLNVALQNAPRERQAQVLANAVVKEKRLQYPDMDKTQRKRIESQALQESRARLGAKKKLVEITDREWEAIQAGAISDSKLSSILSNTDVDRVKELATPRTQLKMTSTKTARANSMLAAGYTRSEVADALGVSLTTLDTATVGEE